MVKEFSVISELKAIRKQKSSLSEREMELSVPVLHDYSLIERIYGWLDELASGHCLQARPGSPLQRKYFIFIIVFLYSPSSLAGGKMKIGLRDSIAKVIGCSGSLISHNCEEMAFFYVRYKVCRQDIDFLYTEIINRLRISGLIE